MTADIEGEAYKPANGVCFTSYILSISHNSHTCHAHIFASHNHKHAGVSPKDFAKDVGEKLLADTSVPIMLKLRLGCLSTIGFLCPMYKPFVPQMSETVVTHMLRATPRNPIDSHWQARKRAVLQELRALWPPAPRCGLLQPAPAATTRAVSGSEHVAPACASS